MSRSLAFAGATPRSVPGSIRDNLSLRRSLPTRGAGEQVAEEDLRRASEEPRSGNPLVSARLDWIDYEATGAANAEEVDGALLEGADVTGALGDVYRFGVLGRFGEDQDAGVLDTLVEARHLIRDGSTQEDLAASSRRSIPAGTMPARPSSENFLFGVAVNKQLGGRARAGSLYARHPGGGGLIEPLIDIGPQLAEMADRHVRGPAGGASRLRALFVDPPTEMALQGRCSTAQGQGIRDRSVARRTKPLLGLPRLCRAAASSRPAR